VLLAALAVPAIEAQVPIPPPSPAKGRVAYSIREAPETVVCPIFWNQVKGTTAPTWEELLLKLVRAQSDFWAGNAILADVVYRNGAELEAYAYSDTIAPRYAYQNCGAYWPE
jgi:hypothetical protein